jgi:hypothetical protein
MADSMIPSQRAGFSAIVDRPPLKLPSAQPTAPDGPLDRSYDHIGKFDGVLHWNGEQMLDWYAKTAGVTFAQPA